MPTVLVSSYTLSHCPVHNSTVSSYNAVVSCLLLCIVDIRTARRTRVRSRTRRRMEAPPPVWTRETTPPEVIYASLRYFDALLASDVRFDFDSTAIRTPFYSRSIPGATTIRRPSLRHILRIRDFCI